LIHYWNSALIKKALARSIPWWQSYVIPNVKLTGRIDEIDLAILTKKNCLWEIEIKISFRDWERDNQKQKWLMDYPIHLKPARFYYAVPIELVKDGIPSFVPKDFGIIGLKYRENYEPHIVPVRVSKKLHNEKVKLDTKLELLDKLGRRYWEYVAGVQEAPHDTWFKIAVKKPPLGIDVVVYSESFGKRIDRWMGDKFYNVSDVEYWTFAPKNPISAKESNSTMSALARIGKQLIESNSPLISSGYWLE
jgi:hypothetical protein